MLKKNIKNEKGVTLIALIGIVIAILVVMYLIILGVNNINKGKIEEESKAQIQKVEGTSEKAKIINSKIGQDVKYSGYKANYTGGWKIFYATNDEVYIITTETTEIGLDIASKCKKYKGSADVRNSTYGATWNSIWLSKCKNNESTAMNAKAVAYLCDSSNWQAYVGKGASYAVGSPTMELIAISLKTSGGEDSTNAFDLTSKEGYNVGFEEDFTGMYFVGGKPWWIASPSNGWVIDKSGMSRMHDEDLSDDVRIVRGYGSINNEGIVEDEIDSMGIRPIVSIPMSNLNEKTLTINSI